jgi:hypothetical protein
VAVSYGGSFKINVSIAGPSYLATRLTDFKFHFTYVNDNYVARRSVSCI